MKLSKEIKKQIEYAYDDIKTYVFDRYGWDDKTGHAIITGALMMRNMTLKNIFPSDTIKSPRRIKK